MTTILGPSLTIIQKRLSTINKQKRNEKKREAFRKLKIMLHIYRPIQALRILFLEQYRFSLAQVLKRKIQICKEISEFGISEISFSLTILAWGHQVKGCKICKQSECYIEQWRRWLLKVFFCVLETFSRSVFLVTYG